VAAPKWVRPSSSPSVQCRQIRTNKEADQTQKGTDFLTKDKGITNRVMRIYPPVADPELADSDQLNWIRTSLTTGNEKEERTKRALD